MSTLKDYYAHLEYKIKRFKDLAMMPFLESFSFIGVSPLSLSICALLFGLGGAFALFFAKKTFLILMALSVLFDMLDGGLARKYKGKTWKGGFWVDYILDRIVALTVMISVYFSISDRSLIYIFVPVVYFIVHLIYSSNRKHLIIVYCHPAYYFLIFYNPFLASVFSLSVDALNLIIFLIYFLSKSFIKSNV